MNMADAEVYWHELAANQDWQGLLAATQTPQSPHLVLQAAKWRVRALRILNQGAVANQILLSTAESAFEARVSHVAELAEELVQCGYYEAAAHLAARLQAAKAPHAVYLEVMLWREREDWHQCEAALSRLKSYGPPWESLALLHEAWAMLRQGRLAKAADLLLPLSDHSSPAVQKLLARQELAQGRHQAAATRLERVAQQQPFDWEWPTLLALALSPSLASHQPERLLALYQQGLMRQPRQAEALANRARLYISLGRSEQAQVDCEIALSIKPWLDAPVLMWVEHALARNELAEAKELLAKARQRRDTPRRAGAALDLIRFEGGKRTEIRPLAEALTKQFPTDVHAWRTAGVALQQVKLLDPAARCYAKALELAPDDTATRNNLALLCRDRGDLEEAISIWRDALDQADVTVRLNYAHTLLHRGDRYEAESIFQDILQEQPHNPVALRGMADAAYAAGDDVRAWKYARRSVELQPANPLAWKVAAGILRRLHGESPSLALLEQGEAQARPVLVLRRTLFRRWRAVLAPAELRQRVQAWCSAHPAEAAYWLMAADAAHDANDFPACERALTEAFRIDPDEGGVALARFYLGREREGAARRVAEQLVRTRPDNMRNWGLLAEVLHRQEHHDEALTALDSGLKCEPFRLSLVRQKVGILLATEKFDSAVNCAHALAEAEPKVPQLALLVEAFQRARRHEDAEWALRKGLQRRPGDRVLRLMLANALSLAGKHGQALDTLEKLYADEPGNFNVVRQYALELVSAGRLLDAVDILQKMIKRNSHQPDLLAAVAELLREQGALNQALEILRQGLQSHPGNLELWRQRIALHKRTGDHEGERATWVEILQRFTPGRWAVFAIPDLVRLDLIEPLQTALNDWRVAEPASIEPWWAAFRAAREMKRDNLALELLDKIEKKRGPQAEIHAARASLLQDSWALGQAQAEIRRAIALRPDNIAYRESLFNILVKAGDFDEFEEVMARLQLLLGDRRYGQYRNFFFNINCHPTWDAAQVWRFYKDWYERAVLPGLAPYKPWSNSAEPQRRLRIGYISPDFRRHAVAYFSEPLLVEHDREQFEIFAYAHLDGGVRDAYTERFKSYVHHWIETTHLSDDELERRIREDGIDILIDLAGHTANNRLTVMLKRPAPVQASWIWGAGQTTGLPQVDYLLTDAVNIPPAHEPYIAEKVLRMSHAGMPFIPAHDVLEPAPLPCLTNGFVTFGVLARPVRTNRQTIALWARVLHRLPNALLRFDHVPYGEADVQERMIAAFAEHGIGRERLQFLNTRPHWHVYQEIDIQLDPFPAGSATTASEGLYMERLVITLQSRPPMGLMPDGQVKALDLDVVCSASTEDEYVEKAVALASDIPRLAKLSDGLRARMRASWLMDYSAYGREAARLYRQMWQQWCADQQARGTKRDMQA